MTILNRPREVEDAADLLVHYFTMVWNPDKSGHMTSDVITEIRSIAYSIYDATRD